MAIIFENPNMRELRNINYEIEGGSSAHSSELKKSLIYIDRIASIAEKKIDDWDVLEIFKNPKSEKGYIHTDKNKINEVFFNYLDGKKQEPEPYKMPKKLLERLNRIFKDIKSNRMNSLIHRVKELENKIYDTGLTYNNCIKELIEKNKLLTMVNNDPQYEIKQIDQILSGGFWQLTEDVGTSYLEFSTPEIILHHINPAQKIDISVPVGRFLARLRMNDDEMNFPLMVYPMDEVDGINSKWSRNIKCSNVWHPHVHSNNVVCFGSAQHEYSLAISKLDYVKVMELLKLVLTTYNDGSPYSRLYEIKGIYEKRIKDELAKKEQKEKEKANGASPDMASPTIEDIERAIIRAERPPMFPDIRLIDGEYLFGSIDEQIITLEGAGGGSGGLMVSVPMSENPPVFDNEQNADIEF